MHDLISVDGVCRTGDDQSRLGISALIWNPAHERDSFGPPNASRTILPALLWLISLAPRQNSDSGAPARWLYFWSPAVADKIILVAP
ncbi:hypothetical protein [Rhizobium leguminosarum]|uniref:hypothetical protein n=1 Tax=Rhizobium leguminosarum TaxID=384 RepID=UPI001C9480B3|nr:hypothetical protein [Rhizobium leguminosarum]MBY5618794.1 hypothetical protein [Rhizobium leguminosarum]